MSKLKIEDIESLFWQLTEIEKESCAAACEHLGLSLQFSDENSSGLAIGHHIAIEQCRKILKNIIKDVEQAKDGEMNG